jgi:hypothetical protein
MWRELFKNCYKEDGQSGPYEWPSYDRWSSKWGLTIDLLLLTGSVYSRGACATSL